MRVKVAPGKIRVASSRPAKRAIEVSPMATAAAAAAQRVALAGANHPARNRVIITVTSITGMVAAARTAA
jgi:hypothetical protein